MIGLKAAQDHEKLLVQSLLVSVSFHGPAPDWRQGARWRARQQAAAAACSNEAAVGGGGRSAASCANEAYAQTRIFSWSRGLRQRGRSLEAAC